MQQIARAMVDPNAKGSSKLITIIKRVVMVGMTYPPTYAQGTRRSETVAPPTTQA